MRTNEITRQVIQCAIEVHKTLGPGLLESSYKHCLLYELQQVGLDVEYEKPVPLIYKDVRLDCGYRLDLVVENEIIVELKSIEALNEVHMAQMITYLKLTDKRFGLLINFNEKRLMDGVKRVVHGY